MDGLKQYGAVIGAHYEKVVLSIILLALLAAAAYLPIRASQNRETINQALELERRSRKKESEPVDTTLAEQLLRRSKTPPTLELSGDHNLFNPVTWKRSPNGQFFKVVRGDEEGPIGLVVTEIRPLSLVVEFEGAQLSGETLRYKFNVLDETRRGRSISPRPVFLSRGPAGRNDPFSLTGVTPPEDDPPSVEIRFPDSANAITITREKPYTRVSGYEADMTHERLGQNFKNIRARQPGGIRLGTQTYNIVAINGTEVTVQSNTSSERWTIRRQGSF